MAIFNSPKKELTLNARGKTVMKRAKYEGEIKF